MSSSDDILMTMQEENYIPDYLVSESVWLVIDENMRIVDIPKNGLVAGVVGDKNVNRVNFKMNKNYNGFDMSEFTIRVNYKNANGSYNYYTVDDAVVDGNSIKFSWLVDSDVTAYAGTVSFVVHMFKAGDDGVKTQAFYSTVAKCNVLDGIIIENQVDPDDQYDILTKLSSDLEEMVDEIIESLPDDYTALSEKVESLEKSLGFVRECTFEWNTEYGADRILEFSSMYKKGGSCTIELTSDEDFYGVYLCFGKEDLENQYQEGEYSNEHNTNIRVPLDTYDCLWFWAPDRYIGQTFTVKVVYKNPDPKHYNTFSVLGDSYGTFEGYLTPNDNVSYYPYLDVEDASSCWWYLFANEYGSRLLVNNSYSGSPICNDGYGEGTDDAEDTSFLARMTNLGNPELILILGGTNDDWANVEIGEYVYSNWTAENKSEFRGAMAYMLDYLLKHHLGTKLIFIKNTDLKDSISGSIDTICDHYDVDVVELEDIEKEGGHPTASGMIAIKDQLIKCIDIFQD